MKITEADELRLLYLSEERERARRKFCQYLSNLRDDGVPVRQLAEALGISEWGVYRRLRRWHREEAAEYRAAELERRSES